MKVLPKYIYNQVQVNKISLKLLDSLHLTKKNYFIKIAISKYLHIRISKNKECYSANYIFRKVINNKSIYRNLGSIWYVKLKDVILISERIILECEDLNSLIFSMSTDGENISCRTSKSILLSKIEKLEQLNKIPNKSLTNELVLSKENLYNKLLNDNCYLVKSNISIVSNYCELDNFKTSFESSSILRSYIKNNYQIKDFNSSFLDLKKAPKLSKHHIFQTNNKKQELTLPNLPISSFTTESKTNLTIKQLLEEYSISRNLKPNTIKAYDTAINCTCYKLLESSISEININNIIKNFSTNTTIQYLTILNTLFAYAKNRKYVTENSFEHYRDLYVPLEPKHRAALDCEYFDSIENAEKQVGIFLGEIYQNSEDINYFLLFLAHMVLGTRISETVRVIKNFDSELNKNTSNVEYVKISIKSTKKGQEGNFRIPICTYLKPILQKVHNKFIKYSDEYLKKILADCIPKSYRKKITCHGSRAIFRTVIELYNPLKYDLIIREFYLGHVNLSTVQKAYIRTDYLNERNEIQEWYITWIKQGIEKYFYKKISW